MDEAIHRLPPDWKITPAVTPLAEVVDPFKDFLGVSDLQAKNAGEIKGKPLIFAVLDTGVDANHRDLQGQLLDARDFSGSVFGPDDRNGHGTWCGGVIAAKPDNYGIRGVAYKGKLLCGKVLGDNGSGSDRMISRGMGWAYASGADIFSLSLGGGRMSEALHDEFREISQQKGKFIFCAAGNDAGPVNYPAAWEEVIAVGAVDKHGRMTDFTSRGRELDILAPGQDILSTIPGNRHGTMTGTSMATPITASLGGLIYAAAVEAGHGAELDDVHEMLALLKKTSRDMDTGSQFPLIDPRKLSKAFDPLPPPPILQPPRDGVVLYVGGVATRVAPWAP